MAMVPGEKEVSSLSEMREWVKSWSNELPEKAVLLLCGEVGAGKTQIVQFLVEALGGIDSSSPSYAIHNRYELPSHTIDHFDLYRLNDDDDLESTGFWDFFSSERGIIAIEWADRLNESIFSPDWQVFRLDILRTGENSRKVSLISHQKKK